MFASATGTMVAIARSIGSRCHPPGLIEDESGITMAIDVIMRVKTNTAYFTMGRILDFDFIENCSLTTTVSL
jgi:hypothetical protein